MPLYGTLRTMPLRDLLQWIGQTQNTGTLQVEHNHVRKWLVIREGRIVSSSSDAAPSRLGHFLLSQGRITEDQLRAALLVQEHSNRQLGGLFVDMGALTDEELSAHLNAQAEERIFSLFDWPDAVFRFHEEIDESPGFKLCLEIEEVLRRGAERVEELTRIRAVFPDREIVLRNSAQAPPDAVLQNPMARQLYDTIDGVRTIAEILLHVHGSEFMVTRFLYELHRAAFVEIVPLHERALPVPQAKMTQPEEAAVATPAPEPPAKAPAAAPAASALPLNPAPAVAQIDPARILNGRETFEGIAVEEIALDDLEWDDAVLEETSEILDIPDLFAESSDVEAIEDSVAHQVDRQLEKARQQLSAGDYHEALILLDELYRQYPDDDALRRMLAEAEAAFKDKAYRHYVPAHMIPRLKTSIDQLETQNLSPTEFFLISRIDGTWNIKSIIQVAPIREVEALMTLKRMREQGLIELRDPE